MLLPPTALQAPPLQQYAIVIKQELPAPEPPQTYAIQPGDTLTKIATDHGTTVERLWAKNPQLASPDMIEPNQVLMIPKADEVLADRPLPSTIESVSLPTVSSQSSAPSGRSSVSGNSYSPGFCTWHAKNVRPDMPNNLGNADTWYVRYTGAKGSTPAVGAVAVARGYMHVAIVEQISDSRVLISEMNYEGWGVVSSRWAPASEFTYLY